MQSSPENAGGPEEIRGQGLPERGGAHRAFWRSFHDNQKEHSIKEIKFYGSAQVLGTKRSVLGIILVMQGMALI